MASQLTNILVYSKNRVEELLNTLVLNDIVENYKVVLIKNLLTNNPEAAVSVKIDILDKTSKINNS